jgi:hypothetical protein
LLGGGETVTVLVLVLIDVLMLGSVVVVVVSVDGVVVSVLVDGGVVSVTVSVGATSGADDVDVVVVVLVVVSVLPDESSDIRLTANHTISATRIAMRAPKPISAGGLRYQGVGSSGGSPGC